MTVLVFSGTIWASYERRENFSVASDHDRGNGVKQGLDGEGKGTPSSLSGGQEPPSLPGNPVPLTSGKGGANPTAPGYASYSPRETGRRTASPDGDLVGSSHGVRHVPGSGSPSSLGLTENRAGALRQMATNAARLCGVPVALFHALIARESGWDPRARSSSGALGLGQLMPAAAREMGVEDRLDPWQNLVGSACYLRAQFKGSWRRALLSYHAGASRKVTRKASHDYAADIMEGSAQ